MKLNSLIFLFTLNAFADDLLPFQKSVEFITNDCSAIVVDLSNGKLNKIIGDNFTAHCTSPVPNFNMTCSFYDKKAKKFDEMKAVGGVGLVEGAISSERGPVDGFILNMKNGKFYYEGTSRIHNGKKQFKKVCAGDWKFRG